MIDLFALDQIKANLIAITPDLGELFTAYWSRVMQPDQRSTIALPFFHLWKEKQGFWHLIARPGKESFLAEAGRNPTVAHTIRFSVTKLNDTILGASLDEDLYALLHQEDARSSLREVLIKNYFEPSVQDLLREQSRINTTSFRYSQALLNQARAKLTGRGLQRAEDFPTAVRDQGFRRAVVTAYDHRCAFCSIRILTLEGHTIVAAAHIIPWSVSHNDDPRNGMALCRVCHWCFDEGLIGVTPRYKLVLSGQLTVDRNMPNYMLALSDKSIHCPADKQLWPDPDSLRWHYQHVFRKS